jgi:hypothetical protein
MPHGYDTHADYMSWVQEEAAARRQDVLDALHNAFSEFIELREVEVINFSNMTAMDLAHAIREFPLILKPILAACNVAGRAVERDLDMRNLDTYRPRLDAQKAAALAGYLKPFLPQELAVPALTELDRHFFVDKQIRMLKGQWEKQVRQAINHQTSIRFKKRKFVCDDEQFEIDAAAPPEGEIEIAVDVKRIEARRDIHKRCDEIVNKATKFKRLYPNARFAAVVYYPFTAEHVNVQHRLESPHIDAVVFASQSQEQLQTAVGLLLGRLRIRKA